MDGLSARVRSRRSRVRGDDSRRRRSRRFESFFSSASFATTAAAPLLAPATRGFGDPPPPPPPWRATLLAAGVAGALREVAESWVAAWTTRALPGGHRLDPPFSVAAADAFVAVAKARQPGRRPDARAVRRRRVGARVRRRRRARRPARPHAATRRWRPFFETERPAWDASEQKNAFVAAAGCAAGNLVAETVGREAAVAVCQLMDCEERGEGGGASRGEGGGRGAADGGSSSAVSSSAVSSAAASELDAPRGRSGETSGRGASRCLSLDAWVTPAKATLAAALARRPSSREALRGAGATERVAETLARLTRNAAERAEASFAARRDHDDDDDDDGGGGGREGGSLVDRSRSGPRLTSVDLDDPDVDLPRRSVFDDFAYAPLAWRPGEASLVASCVRALAELARDADAADAAAIRTAVPALAATVRALASEEAAESLGGGLGEETRCWATLATRCLRAPRGVRSNGRTPSTDVDVDVGIGSVAWGKVAVAAALADALPATYAGDVEDEDDDDAETAAAAAGASPAAAPNVVFRHATGERTPAHAAILAARCPALLRGVDAADADRRDGSSSPGTTVRVARLGAGVTARALRVALTWAYSGATAIDFAAIDDATSDEASTLATVARSCGLRDLDATLRARGDPRSARVGALTRDLDALVRPTARHSDLRLEAQDAVRGKDAHDGDVDDVDGARGDDSMVELSAHAVVMCARSAYCRGALSDARLRGVRRRRGFLFDARDASSSRVDAERPRRAPRRLLLGRVPAADATRGRVVGERRGGTRRRVGIPHDGRGGGGVRLEADAGDARRELERDGGSGGGDGGSDARDDAAAMGRGGGDRRRRRGRVSGGGEDDGV